MSMLFLGNVHPNSDDTNILVLFVVIDFVIECYSL